MVNNYKFFSVFQNKLEYVVYGNSKQIGTITESVRVGDKLKLAGQTWEVTSIDNEKFKIYTKLSSGTGKMTWSSDASSDIAFKIINKMKEILKSEDDYIYLQENTKKLLKENRDYFKKHKLNEKLVISSNVEEKIIFPWLSTKSLITFSHILKSDGVENSIVKCNGIPLGLKIDSLITEGKIKNIIEKIFKDKISIDEIKLENIELNKKYSEYIPDELKEKEYRYDYLDIGALKKEIKIVLNNENTSK